MTSAYAETTAPDTTREKLGSLIDGIHIAMLTTVDATGELRSRPMGSQGLDDNGKLTFFTRRDSDLVDEATSRPVNVSFVDIGKNTYVSVSGHVQLDTDRALIRELWKPEYKAWFPEGVEDPSIALLRMTIGSAEYWDMPGGPLTRLAEFAKAATGSPRTFGEHAKV
jgi:general stress protein 26